MKKMFIWLCFVVFFIPGVVLALNSSEAVVEELAPKIRIISLDVSAYQKEEVRRRKSYVMAPLTNLKIQYEGIAPYGVKIEPIIIDEGSPQQKTYVIKDENIVSINFVPGTTIPQTITVDFNFDEKLSAGKHLIAFYARSLGKYGKAAQSVERLATNVIGGPIRIISSTLTYPSPFSIKRDRDVIIQYRLSEAADIDILIIGVDGERFKRLSYTAGQPGGKEGLNKVSWDGKTDLGFFAGNGIYTGIVIDKDNDQVISKFKLTILN